MLHDLGMPAHVFHEVLGFRVTDGTETLAAARRRIDAVGQVERRVRVSLAPHAPYSVSPALFMSIAGELRTRHHRASISGNRPRKSSSCATAAGRFGARWSRSARGTRTWTPPRCGPVEYIEKFGLLSERLLAVHGVQLSYRELAQLAAAGATLVTCPRSNRWVGAGSPPVERFYASGVRVAIGTDSLASVEDLNLFAEMAQIRAPGARIPGRRDSRKRHPRSARRRSDSATDYGTIEPGKRAALIAVRVPDGVEDVEEYLVERRSRRRTSDWLNR